MNQCVTFRFLLQHLELTSKAESTDITIHLKKGSQFCKIKVFRSKPIERNGLLCRITLNQNIEIIQPLTLRDGEYADCIIKFLIYVGNQLLGECQLNLANHVQDEQKIKKSLTSTDKRAALFLKLSSGSQSQSQESMKSPRQSTHRSRSPVNKLTQKLQHLDTQFAQRKQQQRRPSQQITTASTEVQLKQEFEFDDDYMTEQITKQEAEIESQLHKIDSQIEMRSQQSSGITLKALEDGSDYKEQLKRSQEQNQILKRIINQQAITIQNLKMSEDNQLILDLQKQLQSLAESVKEIQFLREQVCILENKVEEQSIQLAEQERMYEDKIQKLLNL